MDSKLLFHAPIEHTFPIEKTLLLAETDLPPVMKLLFHIKFNENEVGLSVALFHISDVHFLDLDLVCIINYTLYACHTSNWDHPSTHSVEVANQKFSCLTYGVVDR